MAGVAAPSVRNRFPLDSDILGPNSALTLEAGGATDADVVQAILSNTPFPTRPNGVIDLAHISLQAAGGNDVAFNGGSTTVGFQFSAGVTAGAGVFDDPQAAVTSLGLDETPGLDLSIGAAPATRYLLLRAGYTASGSVSGSHPIGAIGSFTFGASGQAQGLSAVLHRFPSNAGADTALAETVKSWKFPRHITAAGKLTPGTWIVAEAGGSLSIKLAASLGYNFNFVKDVKAFGLSGDIGLKIDAAATATFGFDVSGRYLVVVGRESDAVADQELRLRLFKLKTNGLQFGLNLKLGVTGVATILPNQVDDFVSAVFGVHGAQIVTALQQIEKWTDPSKSVGQLIAGLVNDKALQLLHDLTGIDPAVAFNAARAKVLDAIHLYQNLPAQVSSELLGFINKLSPQASTDLQNALTLLATTDQQAQKNALLNLLNTAGFAGAPIGKLLSALADHGLLNLLDRLPEVRGVAQNILSILDGGIIAGLEDFINDKLNLNLIIKAVNQNDFDHLDSFLVGRLSTFFDKTLGFADLNEIKNAINLVVSKRQEIYEKARTALNSRYGVELAATWQRTSASTALADVVFDMADPAARQLFEDVVTVANSALDRLFTTQLATVHINSAVISHELTRRSTLEISLPHFNFQTQSVTTALAKVTPEDDGGRILVYDATGSNTVSVRNKFASSLSLTIASAVARTGAGALSDLRIHSTDANTWSYRLLYAKATMKREELEAITRPFFSQFMPALFPAASGGLGVFYSQLEDTSEKVLHNGPETYGDVCASFEVTVPGDALGAWLLPVQNIPAVSKAMSVAIQTVLKEKLPLFYLTDIGKLRNLASTQPLLAWAAIPPATGFDGTHFTQTGGNDVFWDHPDINLRRAAATNPATQANLRAKLQEYRHRLDEAGQHNLVGFYQDNQVGTILSAATTQPGDTFLASLLFFESQIVGKAKEALNDVQSFLAVAGTSPTKAVDRLAEFAADITTAFNKLIGQSVFADLATFRSVGEVVFLEASRVLSPALGAQPRAMLTLDILNKPTAFQLPTFLAGQIPANADIAVAQRLVSA